MTPVNARERLMLARKLARELRQPDPPTEPDPGRWNWLFPERGWPGRRERHERPEPQALYSDRR